MRSGVRDQQGAGAAFVISKEPFRCFLGEPLGGRLGAEVVDLPHEGRGLGDVGSLELGGVGLLGERLPHHPPADAVGLEQFG
ncbi:MAG TPA: hypothetical protein VGI55_06290 [Solirubrobacteraceae bacterium]